MSVENTGMASLERESFVLRRLKRSLLLLLSLLAAFILIELVVSDLVGYPRRPRYRQIVVTNDPREVECLRWEQPYAKTWSVEGGNNVIQYNNVGLPGCDITVNEQSRYVFVLGSSFVEAVQVNGSQTATSVLQKALRDSFPECQVLNLGISGADLFTAWLRARYFATKFQPSMLILVLQSFPESWYAAHRHPLDFTLPPAFGAEASTPHPTRELRWMREKSALVNMILEAFRKDAADRDVQQSWESPNRKPENVSADMIVCLQAFKRSYGQRFVVISMMNSEREEDQVAAFCSTLDIAHVKATPVLRLENRFGKGHLNVAGNQELGNILYDAFRRMCQGMTSGIDTTHTTPVR